ncbi:hypothetical protein STPH1_2280 [Streptomyces sp. OM5714]|nr:hypothetical protein STPH1_2280 [Streptomyces sp. OM5714]
MREYPMGTVEFRWDGRRPGAGRRRGSSRAHIFERRDLVRLRHLAIRTRPFRGDAMSKSDNGSPPEPHQVGTSRPNLCGNLPFRPEDLRNFSLSEAGSWVSRAVEGGVRGYVKGCREVVRNPGYEPCHRHAGRGVRHVSLRLSDSSRGPSVG